MCVCMYVCVCVGGWVVDRKRKENEAIRMSCCMGGWVGGWVGGWIGGWT